MHLSVCLSPLPTYNRQTFNNWTLDAIISAVNYKHCDRLSQNSSIFGKITQWCVIICVSLFLNRLHHMHRIHVAYFYRCRMFRGLCRSVCSTQCLVSSTKGINRSRCRFWGGIHVLAQGTMGCRLTPPGEYDWTIRARQRSVLVSNYFENLNIFNELLSFYSDHFTNPQNISRQNCTA